MLVQADQQALDHLIVQCQKMKARQEAMEQGMKATQEAMEASKRR